MDRGRRRWDDARRQQQLVFRQRRPRELAELFEEQGEPQEDPYYLARVNFERAGQPERAELCHAKALLFERRFEEAGDMFISLRRGGDAAHCYWMQNSLDKLRTLLNHFPELKSDARCLAAQFLQEPKGLPEAQIVLEAICRLRPQAGQKASAADKWSEFFFHLIERLVELSEGVDPPSLDSLAQQVTKTLKHLGISSTRYPRLGELLYRCDHPGEAIEHWRRSNVDRNPDPEWLLRALAETEPYPERLKYLKRLRDYSGIVRAFLAEGTVPTDQFYLWVLESAKETRNGEALLRLVKLQPRIEALMVFLEIAAEQRHRDWLASLPSLLIQGFIRAREWKQLLSFACDQTVSEGRCNSLLQEQRIRWDARELRTLAVRLLARSDELARETENNQQKVSKFLRECLLLGSECSETIERMLRETGVNEGGAAFERANHLTSALQYYEQWLGGGPLQATRDEQKTARIRWLICKRRLASWHKEKASEKQSRQPELAAQQSTDVLSLEAEARNKAAEWGVSAEGASQYPELEARLASIALPPIEPDQRTAPSDRDDLDLDVGGRQLHVHVLRRRRRVVLTDRITQEQVTLDHGEPWSDDLDVRQLQPEGLKRRWEVTSWGIVIELETNAEGAMVRIRNTTTGSEQFSMPIPK